MKIAPLPPNEEERLEAVRQLGLFDTLPEKDYDDLTHIASQICGVPMALITLIGEDRQFFKSHHGIDETGTPREIAFCNHTILEPEKPTVMPDLHQDERFRDNPLVTGPHQVTFYAGVPVVNPAGHPLGTICVLDTKPNQLNASQLESLQVLANQAARLFELHEKVRALETNEQRLEANNEELSHLSYLLSHDIRSPLNSLSSLLKILQEEFSDQLDEDGKEILELGVGSTERLSNLVSGILEYFKTTHKLRSGSSSVDLNQLLKKVVDLSSPPSEATISYPTRLPTIEVPMFVLEQVLLNLISNAIKHNHSKRPVVEIDFSATDTHFEFRVADNGSGVPSELRPKLFKLFETTGKPDRNGKESTGIGLAIVKKLLDEVGGKVSVEDGANGGAVFQFRLPK